MNPLRQVHHFFQQAVEAVPDHDALFHRLDVDVAGATADRAVHDEIHEVDDGRRVAGLTLTHSRRGLLEDAFLATPDKRPFPAGISLAPGPARELRHRQLGRVRGVDDRRQRLVGIPVFDRFNDVAACRDHLLDPVAGLELQILDEAEKQRVRHRHGQQILLEIERDADALEGNFFGNQDDRGRIRGGVGKADVGEPKLIRQGLGDLLFGREVQAYQDSADALAAPLMLRKGDLEVVLRDEPRLDEALADFLPHRRPRSCQRTAYVRVLGERCPAKSLEFTASDSSGRNNMVIEEPEGS